MTERGGKRGIHNNEIPREEEEKEETADDVESEEMKVIAFDLYGTLLSTESIAAELANHYGDDKAKTLAAQWRRYQLEYTWRINSMGIYRPFSDITRAALQHAVKEKGLSLSLAQSETLMRSYDALRVFPEVSRALAAISVSGTVEAYIFSNGTNDMVTASVMSSPDLRPHAELFKSFITVEEMQAFKPDRRCYDHVVSAAGKDGRKGDVWLVSANPFDIVGAKAAGLHAAWVDRAGTGWLDQLGAVIGGLEPDVVASGVDHVVEHILHISK